MKLTTLKPRIQTMASKLPVLVPGSWRTDRQSSSDRGYNYQWQQARKVFLRQRPLCQCPDCQDGKIRVIVATVVDHIIPHRGDMVLFWKQSNWQAMSKQCHDKKTAKEDGGFGHPMK